MDEFRENKKKKHGIPPSHNVKNARLRLLSKKKNKNPRSRARTNERNFSELCIRVRAALSKIDNIRHWPQHCCLLFSIFGHDTASTRHVLPLSMHTQNRALGRSVGMPLPIDWIFGSSHNKLGTLFRRDYRAGRGSESQIGKQRNNNGGGNSGRRLRADGATRPVGFRPLT